jgi:hypothetical protein
MAYENAFQVMKIEIPATEQLLRLRRVQSAALRLWLT